MRVLIVGGGLAGVTTALALADAGCEVGVFEARPAAGAAPGTAEDPGAFLTLGDNGMRALVRMNAAEAVTAVGFPLTHMVVRDRDGAELSTRPLPDGGDPLTAYRCVPRHDLHTALWGEASRRGVELHRGRRLVAVEEDAAGVRATFADGTSDAGELLVGADGLWSTVRTQLDSAAIKPRYAGQRVLYGHTDTVPHVGAAFRFDAYPRDDGGFGLFRSPTGRVHWYARVTTEEASATELAETDAARWRSWLLNRLPAGGTQAYVVAATGAELLATDARDLPSVACWRTGRIVLVGDAVHAASPATGQGASMAFEDAVVLGEMVGETATLAEALAAYERVRRPRVEANVAASAAMAGGRPSSR